MLRIRAEVPIFLNFMIAILFRFEFAAKADWHGECLLGKWLARSGGRYRWMLAFGMDMRRLLPICLLLTTIASAQVYAGTRTLITCSKLAAVDGDTIKCDGINMRDMGDGTPFVSGYNTPEIRKYKCPAEKELGQQAKRRMAQMLKMPGLKIYDSGEDDSRYKRPLVWVILPDGRSVGSVLIKEGLARVWTPDYVSDWCE